VKVNKTINPSLIDLDAMRVDFHKRLFFREAMTHARLGIISPEYIVQVNNYGIEDDTPFMEIDIMVDGSLRDRIKEAKQNRRRGPLFDGDTIKNIAKQICFGLTILHEHNVYYSDLKPENILFIEKGDTRLKIADLGIARIAQGGLLTKAGLDTFFGGTMHYTPQEVVEKKQKANERTDMYSVGVMIFEMITREPLLWSQARSESIDEHSDLSRPVKDLIKRTCQLMGRNNFKSVGELREKLEIFTM
jgi:serine/threonine protein kinase